MLELEEQQSFSFHMNKRTKKKKLETEAHSMLCHNCLAAFGKTALLANIDVNSLTIWM